MKAHHNLTARRLALAVGGVLGVAIWGNWAVGQSPIVFMTFDDDPPGEPSRLSRFDLGVETFAVGTGAASAFQGVTILNGEVLVADYIGEAIQRFSPAGAYLGAFASINNPTFLESDSGGNVYMTHASIGPTVATRFNSAGAVTQTFVHGDFNELHGIDADAGGNVYIADGGFLGTHQLFKFASDGTYMNSIPLGSIHASDLSIDESSQRLFLGDELNLTNGIKVFDISGAVPSLLGSIPTPTNASVVGVHYSVGSGTVLATDFGPVTNNPRGFELTLGGALLQTYTPANVELAFDITTYVPEPDSAAMVLIGVLVLRLVRLGRRP